MQKNSASGFLIPAESLGFYAVCIRDDDELTIADASNRFYTMLGYAAGEITALRKAGEKPVLAEQVPAAPEAGRPGEEKDYANLELKLIRRDGHHIWVSFRMKTLERDGEQYFTGYVTDITLARRSRRIQHEQKEELEMLTANVPGGVLCCRADEELTLTLCSEGFRRLTGYTSEELAGRFQNSIMKLIYPEDRSLILQQIRNGERWSDAMEFTFRIVRKNGSVVWTMSKARCRSAGNAGNLVYGVMVDITDRKKAQDELLASEERYRMILEHVADPLFDCNFETGETYYSPTFLQRFSALNINPKDIDFPLKLCQTNLVADADRKRLLQYCMKLRRTGSASEVECRLREKSGRYVWYSVHPHLFSSGLGSYTRLILMMQDIDRRKRETISLRRKAERDLLTGLYNTVTAMKLVNDIIATGVPGGNGVFFVLDIDNFKDVNDSFGHLCGDRLIIDTARQLRSLFREQDIIARTGGDEFVAFITMRTIDLGQIAKKAAMLNRMFESLNCQGDLGHPLTGSVGAALFPADGGSYEELFRKADAAMYMAKQNGKNSFRLYRKGMEITMQAKLHSESSL